MFLEASVLIGGILSPLPGLKVIILIVFPGLTPGTTICRPLTWARRRGYLQSRYWSAIARATKTFVV